MAPQILIPIDDSPTAARTIDSVIRERARFPSELALLYVVNNDHPAYQALNEVQQELMTRVARQQGGLILEKAGVRLQDAGFTTELILALGNPSEEITRIAHERAFELVVLGRHEGGGQIRDVIFGSVANHVLHRLRCPVLLF